MPVYNVDRFVGRAIESVLNQTLEDFELLVVDDGSKDRSGQIADRFAERDIRVDVIHTENHGAPAARNVALDRARGEYVYFMDADDWAERTMLEDMYAYGSANSLELVVAAFYIETFYGSSDKHTTEVKGVPAELFPEQQDFRVGAWRLFDQNLLYPPWNKLFLRARIEELGLRFRPTFWDDFPFVLDYIRDVEHVGVMDQAYYHFIRARAESETARWRPDMYEKREEEHTWMLELYRHWGLDGDAPSMEMVQRRYAERLVGCIENVCNPQCTLSASEKRAEVAKMISTDRAQVAVALTRPRSKMMAMLLDPIRKGDAARAYRQGCLISFVRRHDVKLFASLKASR